MAELTYEEIAERYGRSRSTIVNTWVKDERWPQPSGKRGRLVVFDASEVEAAVEAITGPARGSISEGEPDELLTLEEVAEAAGLEWSTLRQYVRSKRVPAPVGKRRVDMAARAGGRKSQLVQLYRRGDMAEALNAMVRRHVGR